MSRPYAAWYSYMSSSISFISAPKYGKSVKTLLLSPAGIAVDTEELGRHLFGMLEFHAEPTGVPGYSLSNGFKSSEIPVQWPDFLEKVFQHVDHALLFIPMKQKFQEISKERLLQQNPDLFSLSLIQFKCEQYKPDGPPPKRVPADERLLEVIEALNTLKARGWSIMSIARSTGVTAPTLHNILNAKYLTVSDRVYDAVMNLIRHVDAIP